MRIVLALVLLLGLSGCAGATASADPAPSGTQIPSSTPAATPAPSPTSTSAQQPADLNAVDASDYRTSLEGDLKGVDFDSADRTVHCGIFAPYYSVTKVPLIAGCRALSYNFTPPPPDTPVEIPCDVFGVKDSGPGLIQCNSGQMFAGEYPVPNLTVKTLPVGSTVSWSDVTCTSLEAGTIECTNTATGHGFSLSVNQYQFF